MKNPFRRQQVEERAITAQVFNLDLEMFTNASGENVSSNSILGLSAAWAAVGLLSDSISTLPVDFILEEGDARIPVSDAERPRWADDPGNGLTITDVLGQGMVSLLTSGEAIILTPRDETGQVQALVVLDPDQVQIDPEGKYSALGQPLEPFEFVHIRGLMLPGAKRGCSPVEYAREVFGSAQATQRFGSAFFGNGAWPGIVAEIPGQLSEMGQKALKALFEERHKGASKAHKIGVLLDGAKLSRVSFSPEDSQFLQTKEFQVADVARMFFLDPSMIGGKTGDSLTYSTLEGHDTHFVKFSLMRWIVRWENALTMLWRSEGGPENGQVKLNVKALLRGSTKERYESYAIALENGWMTVNEVRALEDMPPLTEQAPKVGF
jgi:HK97 family phage portal protein